MTNKPFFVLFISTLFLSLPAYSQYTNIHVKPYLKQEIPPAVLDFLDQNIRYARAVSKKYNVPAEFLLCVAGLETGWGSSELSAQANNFFGIKNPFEEGPSYCVWHSDYVEGKGLVEAYDCFKKYSSPLKSFMDYMEHLYAKSCYHDIMQFSQASFDDWVKIVQACGYATDPAYARKLKEIKRKYYFSILLNS